MGFVRKSKSYVLKFTDPDMDGLEVKMKGLSVGEFLNVMKLKELSEDDPESVVELMSVFARSVVSWNLEDEVAGQVVPVAVTEENVQGLDLDFAMTVIGAWIRAINGVSGPLGQTSPAGVPSPAVSIPMDVLSPSL